MSLTTASIILIIVAFIAANLPWINERFLFFIRLEEGAKSAWHCLFEWLILYFIMGGVALGLEQKAMGQLHAQDWEFYAVTVSLFMVFALPGFVYRFDLKGHLKKARLRHSRGH